MAKNVLATLERNAKNEMVQELNGPFQVINAINKKSKDKKSDVAMWFAELGISKLTSEMCLTRPDFRKELVCDDVPMLFLKLRKFESVKNPIDILGSVVIKDVRYAMVQCKFTINDFFASIRDARKVKSVTEAAANELKSARLSAILSKMRQSGLTDEQREQLFAEYDAIAAA